MESSGYNANDAFKETFSGIDDALDINFETSGADEFEANIQKIEERKDKIKDICKSTEFEESDLPFLKEELVSLLLNNRMVLDMLRDSLKIGSAPRMFEVYGSLSNSTVSIMKEIRELLAFVKSVYDSKTSLKEDEVKENDVVMLDMKKLQAIVKKARSEVKVKKPVKVEYEEVDENDDSDL